MKAVNIKVNENERDKIDSFIKAINANEEMAACPAGEIVICVAATNECGIAYAKAVAVKTFDNEVAITVIK